MNRGCAYHLSQSTRLARQASQYSVASPLWGCCLSCAGENALFVRHTVCIVPMSSDVNGIAQESVRTHGLLWLQALRMAPGAGLECAICAHRGSNFCYLQYSLSHSIDRQRCCCLQLRIFIGHIIPDTVCSLKSIMRGKKEVVSTSSPALCMRHCIADPPSVTLPITAVPSPSKV